MVALAVVEEEVDEEVDEVVEVLVVVEEKLVECVALLVAVVFEPDGF